jgi:hypothetical protein
MIADGGEIIKNKKPINFGLPAILFLITAIVFVLGLGISIGLTLFTPRQQTTNVVINPENPNPTEETPKIMSKLATDSAVLQLKSDIAGFASELERIDLIEPQLAPPNIDLNIGIELK